MQISIDGPAGAGKSTVSKELASRLNIIYIDTGAMYRALTWKAYNSKISVEDEDSLTDLAKSTEISFITNPAGQRIFCDGIDITEVIRDPIINDLVAKVAYHPRVREIMVRKQKDYSIDRSIIMDGRDIGELVLPHADFKFFLTASIDVRSNRRYQEMTAKGYEVDLLSLKEMISVRDNWDSTRSVGALKILDDSIVIDTSDLSEEEVLEKMIRIIKEGSRAL